MSWLPLVLQFLPSIITAIANAVNKPAPAHLQGEELASFEANKECMRKGMASLSHAHDHLSSVKI